MKRLWKWAVLAIAFTALYLAFETARGSEAEYWIEQRDLTRAASAAPMTYEAQMKIARAGQGDIARFAYRRALEINPDSVSARIGHARLTVGQYHVANTDLEYLVRKHPEDANSWIARAQYRIGTEDLSGALSDVEKALSLDPGNGDYSALKGLIESRQGDAEAAFIDMHKFVTQHPDQDTPTLPLHGILDFPNEYLAVALHAEEFQAAREYLEEGLAEWRAGGTYRGGSYLDGLITLAECDRNLGEAEAALHLADQVIAGLDALGSSRGFLAPPSSLPDRVSEGSLTNGYDHVTSPYMPDRLLRAACFEKALILQGLGRTEQAQAALLRAYQHGNAEQVNSAWREITSGAVNPAWPMHIEGQLPVLAPESTAPSTSPEPPSTNPAQ